MIVKNRLLDSNFIIYQDDEWFKFSLDSVLLAKFVTVNLRAKNIIDFACGNAPIPMFLSFRTKGRIYGIEYQKCIYDLAVKSINENNLEDKVFLINDDIKNLNHYFESDFFDVITCNPPYFRISDNSFINDNYVKAIARHEIMLKLEDVIKQAFFLLKTGGRFAMIHRTERMIEVIDTFRKYGIEPKRLQFIFSKKNKDSDLFLIEGVKNGKMGLKILPSLIIYNSDDSYSNDVKEILKFDWRC